MSLFDKKLTEKSLITKWVKDVINQTSYSDDWLRKRDSYNNSIIDYLHEHPHTITKTIFHIKTGGHVVQEYNSANGREEEGRNILLEVESIFDKEFREFFDIKPNPHIINQYITWKRFIDIFPDSHIVPPSGSEEEYKNVIVAYWDLVFF